MINHKDDERIDEVFQSLLFMYQISLEASMKGGGFIFDCVDLLYCKLNTKNHARDGLYIDSPDWIKNKKPTINPINKKDNKLFQYAAAVSLNQEQIEKYHEIISKNQHFY